ncbi:MAG: MATE family efflux transporter [Clostridia bacterium]|nr:MATE family efflux transporter [Clostridia bacterium]
MNIQLSDHFTYKKLIRFTVPSVAMMVFSSIYGVVDGFFVSRFVGKTPFAAVNFIMPFLMILGAVGFMIGTGGSALIAKTLGEGEREYAKKLFSFFIYVTAASGIVISALGILLIRPIAVWLGAEGEMLGYCVVYGRIILAALPFFMLQMVFQSFFVTAEKPQLGFWMTVAAGVTNMVLDALFMALFQWGVVGAALATAISQTVGGVAPILYFSRPNSSLLGIGRTRYYGRALLRACTNGSSELMSNISMSVVGMLYNAQLMKFAGEDGVAAYGVLMYVNFIFISMFIGYAVGSAPVVGYHYGAQNHSEMRSLLRKSMVIISIVSVTMLGLGLALAYPLADLYVGYDADLMAMTLRGFYFCSFSFLFSGFAIYGSSFFTALNNGPISALISFLRTLVFQAAAVLILPLIWGIDGIWMSVVIAELMAAVISVLFMIALRKKYQYG